MILATFDLQVTSILPMKLESIALLVQEKKFKIDFQFRRRSKKKKIDFQDGCHGSHFGFLIGIILAIFDLKVTPMLPTKFPVNWPFGSGEETKIRFQDGHLGFTIGTILAIFDLQVTRMLPSKF